MGYVSTNTIAGIGDHEIRITTAPAGDGPSDKTLIVLPGYRYSSEAPAMFYPRIAFLKHRWDVVAFDYRYNEIPGFIDLDETEADEQIRAEATLIREYIVSNISTKSLCLMGKSLGTAALHYLIEDGDLSPHFDRISHIILTPTEFQRKLVQHIVATGTNGFFAIGKNDPYYDDALIQSTKDYSNVHWEVFRNAGHIFESPEQDLPTSIDNVKTLTAVIENRIGRGWFG